jgi:predicted DNA-binding transcriptional regulator AlpA
VLIGFTILCLGLLLFLISSVALAQGPAVPSIIGVLLLGLALIVIGDQIYRRRKRKLINKRQIAQLFGVTQDTIERWLKDGKLPKPKKLFWSRRWDSDELVARRKFKRAEARKP